MCVANNLDFLLSDCQEIYSKIGSNTFTYPIAAIFEKPDFLDFLKFQCCWYCQDKL